MKAIKLIIAILLLVGGAACHKQSADPKKDIVGAWRSQDNKHMFMSLRADGTCQQGYDYLAPSDISAGTYTLITDASGINTLTLKFRRAGFDGQSEGTTKTYEAAVYSDELILGAGASELRFERAKATAP